jgi:DNA-3-methyladenine glycosylase II
MSSGAIRNPLADHLITPQNAALDRPDVLLSGDLALRRAVERAYGFDHLPTQDEMVQLAERWRPYRSLAVSYLFASEYEKGT